MTDADIYGKLREYVETFEDISYLKYKLWIYKDKVYVIDFICDDIKFAFDILPEGESYQLNMLLRNGNSQKFFKSKYPEKSNLLGTFTSKELFEKIKNIVDEMVLAINSRYKYDISVIVPVYNREDLITTCIESLNNQTLDRSRFEVLFVDDYSSDDSVKVIRQTVSKKVHYKVFKRSVNSGGAAAPRNDGILASRGRYLFFFDSDDYMMNDCLEAMLNMAEKNNIYIVYVKFSSDTGRSIPYRPFSKGNVAEADFKNNHLCRSLTALKLFKSSLIKNNKIFFPIEHKIAEDRIFMVRALANADDISILADKPYFNIVRHTGEHLTRTVRTTKSDFSVILECLTSIEYGHKDIKSKEKLFSNFMSAIFDYFIHFANQKAINRKYVIEFFANVKHLISTSKLTLDTGGGIYNEHKDICRLFIEGDMEKLYDFIAENHKKENLKKLEVNLPQDAKACQVAGGIYQ
jgi:glycosyltransferase involved in cell wall biosynthesis